ncbi:MAG TPA: T9SS type A sorting domain-containing protein [Candidatus Marinimicrobia bacterium]|nr:T9SS type A sorting domain-containing protein [Candidatus Neomarinimicrobiota bacterium]
MKKGVYVLIMLAVLSTIVEVGWGQYTGSGTFNEIASLDNLEPGTYYVFYGISGTYTGAMTNTISSGKLGNTSISFSGSSIINPSTAIVWKIDKVGDNYTVYNESISKYCEITGNTTSSFALNESSTHQYLVTYSSGKGFQFQSNHSSANSRCISIYQTDWRTYLSSSTNTLKLYKLEITSGASIIVTPSTLTGFTYIVGSGPSAEQTFTVSGTNLTADISISAPDHFEISKTSDSGFTSSLTLAQSGGSVSETTIYVRLKAGLAIGSYSSENITCSSTGADDRTVTCSGTVTNPAMYYRSKATGNWGDNSTWESSTDQMTWSDASSTPTSNDYTITIKNGHTVTINSSVTIDQVTVENGGTLATGSNMTVNDGSGDDITVQNGGIIIYSSQPTYNSGSIIRINTGGILRISATGLTGSTAVIHATSHIYESGSILEYTPTSSFSASGITYFPNVDENTIPIFRITALTSLVGGANPTVINGIIEVASGVNFSWSGAGTKTFRNGIKVYGNMSQGTSGQFIISATTAEISGTGTASLGSGGLSIAGNVTLSAILDCGAYAITGSGALIVSDDATLKIGSPDGLNGNVQTTGSNSFSSSAHYIFNGTSAQVTGSMLPTTVQNLTINNSNGLSLSRSMIISNTLTMTSGNIITSSNTLTLGEDASSYGNLSRTSGTVIGNFERWFAPGTNSNFIFPVGTESNYRPVTISTAGVATGGKILVSHTDGSGGTNLSSTIEDDEYTINRRSNMYWTLTGNGISGGTYDLSIDADGQEGISDPAKIRLINSTDGNTFSLVGTHSDGNGTVFNRTGISIGTFDRFYLGSDLKDNSLPISLTSFTAQSRSQSVVLSWTTESEIENLGFIIEKQKKEDGRWAEIASYAMNEALQGHGSTSEAHEYFYTDAAVIPGTTYLYRLGDVDYKGKVTWHKAVEVKVEAENSQVPLVFGLKSAYPNPFNPSVTIPYSLTEDGQMSLKVYNLRGQLVETLVNAYALKGAYSYTWQPDNLSAGIYLVRLQSGNHTSMQKVAFVK